MERFTDHNRNAHASVVPRTKERAERSKEEQKHTIAAAVERDGS